MKVAIYPYTLENEYIREYEDLFRHEIKRFLVSGGVLSKAEKIDDRICTFEEITTDEPALNEIEALVLLDSIEYNEWETLGIANYFCSKGKDIIYAVRNNFEKMNELGQKYGVHVTYLDKDVQYFEKSVFHQNSNLEEMDVPVIAVMGIGRNVQKFDLQLYLRKKFTDRGYKVSQIGTKRISELYGFHPVPSFLFTNEYTDVEKIIAFNKTIKSLEEKEKPDVIIIGIPDSIMPLNKKHHFSFGLYAYEICNAVPPDYTIVSPAANDYNNEFYEQIGEYVKYKYNTEVDSYYISKFVPLSNSLWSEELSYGCSTIERTDSENNHVYMHISAGEDGLFNSLEKRLLLYGRFEQF